MTTTPAFGAAPVHGPLGRARVGCSALQHHVPQAPALTAVHLVRGSTTVVRLRGALRSDTAAVVREAVDTALDWGPTTVVIDLTDVTADDELGLWVLPAMAGDTRRRHVALLLVAPSRALRLRLRRLGGHSLDITDTPPPGVGDPTG